MEGASQPVGGFSALLDAPGRDIYWAMPDNGFGNKMNSRSFILRDFGSRGRNRGLPDYSDFIGVRVPDLVGSTRGQG